VRPPDDGPPRQRDERTGKGRRGEVPRGNCQATW
jgi:hypothetical protein